MSVYFRKNLSVFISILNIFPYLEKYNDELNPFNTNVRYMRVAYIFLPMPGAYDRIIKYVCV